MSSGLVIIRGETMICAKCRNEIKGIAYSQTIYVLSFMLCESCVKELEGSVNNWLDLPMPEENGI
jgi:hypothetical protein